MALTAAAAGAAETGAISGFVMDEDGQLLGGALVVVRGANRFATTNANGYYVVTPVPVGTFEVTASRVGYDEQVKSGVKVIAGLRTNLSFRLRSNDTGTISGFVTDEDGRPLSGASVVVTGADISATTDADGYYHIFNVPAGTFDVKALRVDSGERAVGRVNVYAGLRTTLSFHLGSGAPSEKEEKDEKEEKGDIRSQVVDEFADLLIGTPGVVYENDDAPTADGEAPGGGVAEAGTISGTVTDPDGHLLPGASVEVIGEGLCATTNADGYYSIPRVPAGTFDVKATHPKYAERMEMSIKVTPGGETTVSFQLESVFKYLNE